MRRQRGAANADGRDRSADMPVDVRGVTNRLVIVLLIGGPPTGTSALPEPDRFPAAPVR